MTQINMDVPSCTLLVWGALCLGLHFCPLETNLPTETIKVGAAFTGRESRGEGPGTGMTYLYFIYFCLFFSYFPLDCHQYRTSRHRCDYPYVLWHILFRTDALPVTPPPHLSRFECGSYVIMCNYGAGDELARVSAIHAGDQTWTLHPAWYWLFIVLLPSISQQHAKSSKCICVLVT